MDAPLLEGELPAKAEAPRGAMDAPLLEDAVPAKAEAPRGILRPANPACRHDGGR